jgi:hypothetical protein
MQAGHRNPAYALAFVTAFFATVAVIALGAGSARATPPAPVHVELHVSAFCCPQEVGTWDMSGAFTDSGAYVRTGAHAEPSLTSDFAFPVRNGTLQEEFLLTSARGTLMVKTEGLVTPNGEPFGDVAYSWELEPAGTGAYAETSGHGKGYFDRSTLSVVLDGVISKVGG